MAVTMLIQWTVIPVGRADADMMTFANMPKPGDMVSLSEAYVPPMLHGVTIDPVNPFRFSFLVSSGDETLAQDDFEYETQRLIKYFLTSMTVPEEDLWVNLSPHEEDRIIPDEFGMTEMGRELLAQDYFLKQLTSSLMFPETDIGAEFWDEVYTKVYEATGSSEVPVNTFNKIWILPKDVTILEVDNSAYVAESTLKVMLENDMVALDHERYSEKFGTTETTDEQEDELNSVTAEVVKEVILPIIEKEVNEGKSFAKLRQIMNSLVLASWFRSTLKDSLMGQLILDQNKVEGIDLNDISYQDKVYNEYLEAYQKGVYDLVKEEYDPISQTIVPRKYFAGGVTIMEYNITGEPIPLHETIQKVYKQGDDNISDAAARKAAIEVENILRGVNGLQLVETEVTPSGVSTEIRIEATQINTMAGAFRNAVEQAANSNNAVNAYQILASELGLASVGQVLTQLNTPSNGVSILRVLSAIFDDIRSNMESTENFEFQNQPLNTETSQALLSADSSFNPNDYPGFSFKVTKPETKQSTSLISRAGLGWLPYSDLKKIVERIIGYKTVRTANLDQSYTTAQQLKEAITNYFGVPPEDDQDQIKALISLNAVVDQLFVQANANTRKNSFQVIFAPIDVTTTYINAKGDVTVVIAGGILKALNLIRPTDAVRFLAAEITGELAHVVDMSNDYNTVSGLNNELNQEVNAYRQQLLYIRNSIPEDQRAAFVNNLQQVIRTVYNERDASILNNLYLGASDVELDNLINNPEQIVTLIKPYFPDFKLLQVQENGVSQDENTKEITVNAIAAAEAGNYQVQQAFMKAMQSQFGDAQQEIDRRLASLRQQLGLPTYQSIDELNNALRNEINQNRIDLLKQYVEAVLALYYQLSNNKALNQAFVTELGVPGSQFGVPETIFAQLFTGKVVTPKDAARLFKIDSAAPVDPVTQVLQGVVGFNQETNSLEGGEIVIENGTYRQKLPQGYSADGVTVQAYSRTPDIALADGAVVNDASFFTIANVGGILLDLQNANVQTLRRGDNRVLFSFEKILPSLNINPIDVKGVNTINIINTINITPNQIPQLLGLESTDEETLEVSKI